MMQRAKLICLATLPSPPLPLPCLPIRTPVLQEELLPKVGLVDQGLLHTRQVVVVESLEKDESGVIDSGQVMLDAVVKKGTHRKKTR